MKKLLVSLLLFVASTAMAAWPTKDITIIVPYPPGGPADVVARIYGQNLEKALKVNVLIKNMPGPAASVAIAHMMNTENDNHTFLHAGDDFITGQYINGNKMYEQFVPVNVLGKSYPFMIFGGKDSSQEKLIAQIKAGETINVGTLNLPTLFSLWAQNIKYGSHQIKWNFVPYKGGGEISRDVMGGHLEYGVGVFPTSSAEDLVHAGRLKPLLHSGDPRFKNIPSMKELGMTVTPLAGYLVSFVRKDTSPEAIAGFTAALKYQNDHMSHDAIRSVLRYEYVDLDAKGAEQFVATELRTVEKLLKNAPIQKNVR